MNPLDEFAKIEVQALKAEILNLQTLRFTVLGVVATALAAYLGWVTTAGQRLSLADATMPVLLVMSAAVLSTTHFGRLIARGAIYLEVFYQSPWQLRLKAFREVARPIHINTWLALIYLVLTGASTLIMLAACQARSALSSTLVACVLGALFLLCLVSLMTSDASFKHDREHWQSVKAKESKP